MRTYAGRVSFGRISPAQVRSDRPVVAPGSSGANIIEGQMNSTTKGAGVLVRIGGETDAEAQQSAEAPLSLLARFAADLRAGAFEPCEARAEAARALLWRLAITRLREGNPGFLAAHGFE